MAIETVTGTVLGAQAVQGHGWGGNVKGKVATATVAAAASDTSTYGMFSIPSEARLLGISRFYSDDLASTGSPTMDIGLRGTAITNDPDALSNGHDVTGVVDARAVGGIELLGQRAWEFVNGQTTDPGGNLEVFVSLVDADANTGGDISLELFYTLD